MATPLTASLFGTAVTVLLVGVAVVVVLGVVYFTALGVHGWRKAAARHEVVPGQRSSAPASWAGGHSPEAKLHRRLGDAVRAAQALPQAAELGLATKVTAIEQTALAVDTRLVAAAALPEPHRGPAVARLEPSVVALEEAVAGLVEVATPHLTGELLQRTVGDADERLRAMAEAWAEVERLDRPDPTPPPAPNPPQ